MELGESEAFPDIRPPVWTPDGRHVLFAAGRSNNRQVYAAPWGDLKAARLLPAFGQRLVWLAVAKRRAVAVVSQSQSDQNVWRLDLAGPGGPVTGGKSIASTTWDDEEPSFSVATERVLFVSDQSGSEQVWEVGYDGTGLRRLTDYEDANRLQVGAIPGSKLAYVGARFGDKEGVGMIRLGEGGMVREPGVLWPGMLVGSSAGGAYVLRDGLVKRVELGGREERVAGVGKAFVVKEGPGGTGLWHTTQFETRVMRNGVAEGPVIERRAFAPGREGVYFVEKLRPRVVQYRSTADGKARDLYTLPGPVGFGIALRGDEKMLAITVFERDGADLLAVKDFSLP